MFTSRLMADYYQQVPSARKVGDDDDATTLMAIDFDPVCAYCGRRVDITFRSGLWAEWREGLSVHRQGLCRDRRQWHSCKERSGCGNPSQAFCARPNPIDIQANAYPI
jgi:hypothetical protein